MPLPILEKYARRQSDSLRDAKKQSTSDKPETTRRNIVKRVVSSHRRGGNGNVCEAEETLASSFVELQHENREKTQQVEMLRQTLSVVKATMTRKDTLLREKTDALEEQILKNEQVEKQLQHSTEVCKQLEERCKQETTAGQVWRSKYETIVAAQIDDSLSSSALQHRNDDLEKRCMQLEHQCEEITAKSHRELSEWKDKCEILQSQYEEYRTNVIATSNEDAASLEMARQEAKYRADASRVLLKEKNEWMQKHEALWELNQHAGEWKSRYEAILIEREKDEADKKALVMFQRDAEAHEEILRQTTQKMAELASKYDTLQKMTHQVEHELDQGKNLVQTLNIERDDLSGKYSALQIAYKVSTDKLEEVQQEVTDLQMQCDQHRIQYESLLREKIVSDNAWKNKFEDLLVVNRAEGHVAAVKQKPSSSNLQNRPWRQARRQSMPNNTNEIDKSVTSRVQYNSDHDDDVEYIVDTEAAQKSPLKALCLSPRTNHTRRYRRKSLPKKIKSVLPLEWANALTLDTDEEVDLSGIDSDDNMFTGDTATCTTLTEKPQESMSSDEITSIDVGRQSNLKHMNVHDGDNLSVSKDSTSKKASQYTTSTLSDAALSEEDEIEILFYTEKETQETSENPDDLYSHFFNADDQDLQLNELDLQFNDHDLQLNEEYKQHDLAKALKTNESIGLMKDDHARHKILEYSKSLPWNSESCRMRRRQNRILRCAEKEARRKGFEIFQIEC